MVADLCMHFQQWRTVENIENDAEYSEQHHKSAKLQPCLSNLRRAGYIPPDREHKKYAASECLSDQFADILLSYASSEHIGEQR